MSIMTLHLKFQLIHMVLVNRSILCNFRIGVENNFLLEFLAACHDAESKLAVYFMVNIAFLNYLDRLDNLTDFLKFPILLKGLLMDRLYLFP